MTEILTIKIDAYDKPHDSIFLYCQNKTYAILRKTLKQNSKKNN